ncbi:hypothetical protein OG302_17555 [Streptomyces sp. NBC_01283]|uniref:hypothetical protein n=1 Tax=Streptomyces sp. NBC_01283 TaxID=2903812 RepID=UPI00352BFACC|nr:hypothetical protein OG302_17555 [Streptomyces sp. NBC_01283]
MGWLLEGAPETSTHHIRGSPADQQGQAEAAARRGGGRDGGGDEGDLSRHSFGRRTESATKWWQQHEDTEDVDGIVGKETFGVADDYLNGPGSGGHVTYTGHQHGVGFKRLSGTYYVKINGTWKKAAYDRRG